jgi:hypothetical protein
MTENFFLKSGIFFQVEIMYCAKNREGFISKTQGFFQK